MPTNEKNILDKIARGMSAGMEQDEKDRAVADQHKDGEHMDYSYLEHDDEKHLDVTDDD